MQLRKNIFFEITGYQTAKLDRAGGKSKVFDIGKSDWVGTMGICRNASLLIGR